MRAHYLKAMRQLKSAMRRLEAIADRNDLAALHTLVVELKTNLPERLSYENSQILLEGLRVTTVTAMPEYIERLHKRLTGLLEEYGNKAGNG